MAIEQKVRQVEELFDRLEKEIKAFKSETNLHCLSGCGKCCSKPNIDASPLEFLPWAFHLFLNGKAEEVLLKSLKYNETSFAYKWLGQIKLVNNDLFKCRRYYYRIIIYRNRFRN